MAEQDTLSVDWWGHHFVVWTLDAGPPRRVFLNPDGGVGQATGQM